MSPVQRLLNGLDIRQTCTLKLGSLDGVRLCGTLTLRMTRLPPFIATSLLQYHLPPNLSRPLPTNVSYLASPVFNPPAHELRRILATMEPSASLVMPRFASVGDSLLVKYGSRVSIREAMALVYIKQCTSIPVPEVRLCFQHNEKTYIVMDRIKGRTLDDCLSTITDQRLKSIATQLGDFVRQLRTLDTGKLMGSWPSGPYDNVFFDPPPLHEFQDMEEFHAYWIWRLGSLMELPEVPSALCENRPCKVVLTHEDLAPRNILVDGGEITGVVDWVTVGTPTSGSAWRQDEDMPHSSGMTRWTPYWDPLMTCHFTIQLY